MIINVRGTSGSGKSTLTRAVMALFQYKEICLAGDFEVRGLEDRSRPLGYLLHTDGRERTLFVPGHYETACGGCDTIAKHQFENVYSIVRQMQNDGHDVLYEGLLLSAESARAIQLHREGFPFLCIGLTTPLEVCLEGIRARRLAKGGDPAEEFAPSVLKNATSKQKGSEYCLRKMEAAGVTVFRGSRDEALARVRAELAL